MQSAGMPAPSDDQDPASASAINKRPAAAEALAPVKRSKRPAAASGAVSTEVQSGEGDALEVNVHGRTVDQVAGCAVSSDDDMLL